MDGARVQLGEPIGDAVSRIRFAPGSNNLLISSWDSVRYYYAAVIWPPPSRFDLTYRALFWVCVACRFLGCLMWMDACSEWELLQMEHFLIAVLRTKRLPFRPVPTAAFGGEPAICLFESAMFLSYECIYLLVKLQVISRDIEALRKIWIFIQQEALHRSIKLVSLFHLSRTLFIYRQLGIWNLHNHLFCGKEKMPGVTDHSFYQLFFT